MFNSNIKKALIIILLIFSLLVAVYFFVVPRLVNIEKYSPEIKNALREKLNVPVEFKHIDFSTTGRLTARLDINGLKIDNGNVATKDAAIEIAIIPLVAKHIDITKIEIDDLQVNLIRFENGKFNVENYIKPPSKKTEYDVKLKKAKINLNNYKINFSDNYIKPPQKFIITGKDFEVSDFTPHKGLKLKGDAKINGTPVELFGEMKLPFKKYFKLKGSVKNLNLKEFLPYINFYTNKEIQDISLQGDLLFETKFEERGGKNLNVKVSGTPYNIYIVRKKYGKTMQAIEPVNVDVDVNVKKNLINIKKGYINTKDADFSVGGKIFNYRDKKKRKLDLIINIRKARLCKVGEIFPKDIKLEKDYINKAIKYNFDGFVKGNLDITGNSKKPMTRGYIVFNDVSFLDNGKNIPKSYGSIKFRGKDFFLSTRVFVGRKEYVDVKGIISPVIKKESDLKATTSGMVDISKTFRTLLAIRDIFGFKLGILPKMTMEGRGGGKLDIKGKEKGAKLYGSLTIANGKASYSELNKKAENVNGTLVFKGIKIIYDGLTGDVEGIRVYPSGFSTTTGSARVRLYIPDLDLKKGFELVNGSILLVEVKDALKKVEQASGKAKADFFIKGENEKATTTGYIKDFRGVSLKAKGFYGDAKALSGEINFDDKVTSLKNIEGSILDQKFLVNGSIRKNGLINIQANGNNLNVDKLKELVDNSPELAKLAAITGQIKKAEGRINLNLTLKGKNEEDLFDKAEVKINGVSFIHNDIGFPVKVNSGKFLVDKEKLVIQEPIDVNILDSKTRVQGEVTNLKNKTPNYDLSIFSNDINLTKIPELEKTKFAQGDLKKLLNVFDKYEGKANVDIKVKKDRIIIQKINFSQAKVRYKPLNVPVQIEKAELKTQGNDFAINNFRGKLDGSTVSMKGYIRNYLKKTKYDINLDAKISSKTVNKYINPNLSTPLKIKGLIPLKLKISGDKNAVRFAGNAIIDKESSFFILEGSQKLDRIIDFDVEKTKDSLNMLKLLVFTISEAGKEKILEANGKISGLSTGRENIESFSIVAKKPVRIDLFNMFLEPEKDKPMVESGTIEGALTLKGNIQSPTALGKIILRDVKVPSYLLDIDYGDISFNKDAILIRNSKLKFNGNNLIVDAKLDNVLEQPIIVRDIILSMNNLNLDNIKENESGRKQSYVNLSPVVVEDGKFNVNSVKVSNLILNDVDGTFKFSPDWILSIPSIKFGVSGGSAQAKASYNLRTTDLEAKGELREIQANPVATAMLNLRDEVYGTLNGSFQFSTHGEGRKEKIGNSNGYVKVHVEKGHLVRLGSLEYLLRAANVVQSGIAGFNLNNVVDLVVPEKTGYFDVLDGDVKIENGVLKTDGISSTGKNLSLYIRGWMDMSTNYADMTVLGRLSKDVSGLLGPIGSLSINTFINFIPGVGFFPDEPDKGIINTIPGLDKIPLLGLGGDKKYRRFVVEIEGDLYSENAVKSFRWVD